MMRTGGQQSSKEAVESGHHNNIRRRRRRRQLIVNGVQAVKGRYPYFVTLRHYGGGALIAPDIVLTAGHCKPTKKELKHHVTLPKVGLYSFYDDNDDYEQFDIVQAIRHPNWTAVNLRPNLDDDTYDNDVNLDHFANDFTILQLNGTSTKPYIQINRNPQIPFNGGQDVIAMGVGNTDPYYMGRDDSRADTLRQVQLNAISNDACRQQNSLYNRSQAITPSMLCTTGGPNNTRDSCDYDSGSPIIISGDNGDNGDNGGDLLVAIVSWGGDRCAEPHFPAVNARVSAVSDWIDETVCRISSVAAKAQSAFNCSGHSYDQLAQAVVVEQQQQPAQPHNHNDDLHPLHLVLAILTIILTLGLAVVAEGRCRNWFCRYHYPPEEDDHQDEELLEAATTRSNDDDDDGERQQQQRALFVITEKDEEDAPSTATTEESSLTNAMNKSSSSSSSSSSESSSSKSYGSTGDT